MRTVGAASHCQDACSETRPILLSLVAVKDARIFRTGVRLGLARQPSEASTDVIHQRELLAREQAGEVAFVDAEGFVDLEIERERQRWTKGDWSMAAVELDRDPTNQLLELVEQERTNFFGIQYDIAYGELDITRWELRAAPFHIELDPKLAPLLLKAWRPRPPREWSSA